MQSYQFILNLIIILLCTKFFGILTSHFRMPQVVGAIVAGLLLGPAALNLLRETDFLDKMSELGVILLMFSAGLETDFKQLKATGKASFIIALVGVLVPLAGGYLLTWAFNRPDVMPSGLTSSLFLQNVFIGVILMATSVSITVEALREMGKLTSRAGNAILGAAIIDDVLGMIALTLITSFSNPSIRIWVVLLQIVGFFVFAVGFGKLFSKVFEKWQERYQRDMRRFAVVGFIFCLTMAYVAEVFFGVADITGSFIAGLFLSMTHRSRYIESKVVVVSYMLLSPIFFANIGLKVILPAMTPIIVVFAVCLIAVAALSKVIGCGLGARICGFSNRESLQIGVGMVTRGEVVLIVANKGLSLGLISDEYFAPIVLVVVCTAVITPMLLNLVFREPVAASH